MRFLLMGWILATLISTGARAGTCSDFLVRRLDRLAPVAWWPRVSPEKWQISYLDPYYHGEEHAGSAYHSELPEVLRNRPIHYFSNEELQAARVVVRNGRFVRLDGRRVKRQSAAEYVMKPGGEILIMPDYVDPVRAHHRLKHSSLAFGGPVAASGRMTFDEEGEISWIDRVSGHYKPSRLQLRQFLDQLEDLGVDLSGVKIIWD